MNKTQEAFNSWTMYGRMNHNVNLPVGSDKIKQTKFK